MLEGLRKTVNLWLVSRRWRTDVRWGERQERGGFLLLLSSISGSRYAQHRRRAEPVPQRSWLAEKSGGNSWRSTTSLSGTGVGSLVRKSSAHSWRSVATHGQSSATQLSETSVSSSVRRGSAHRRREARSSVGADGRISRLLLGATLTYEFAIAKCSDTKTAADDCIFVTYCAAFFVVPSRGTGSQASDYLWIG